MVAARSAIVSVPEDVSHSTSVLRRELSTSLNTLMWQLLVSGLESSKDRSLKCKLFSLLIYRNINSCVSQLWNFQKEKFHSFVSISPYWYIIISRKIIGRKKRIIYHLKRGKGREQTGGAGEERVLNKHK